MSINSFQERLRILISYIGLTEDEFKGEIKLFYSKMDIEEKDKISKKRHVSRVFSGKFNNIQAKIFHEVSGLREQDFIIELEKWLMST